eukprot:339378-Chlamydomonas_euryale.AAC.1
MPRQAALDPNLHATTGHPQGERLSSHGRRTGALPLRRSGRRGQAAPGGSSAAGACAGHHGNWGAGGDMRNRALNSPSS